MRRPPRRQIRPHRANEPGGVAGGRRPGTLSHAGLDRAAPPPCGGSPGTRAILAHAEGPLALRIRQRRRAAGLTQAALASAAGIRTETLNRSERSTTEPDFSTVRKLAAALRRGEANLSAAPCHGGVPWWERSRQT
ncbi:MAG: helix-turn-helix transcriptional regulator [Planctomycetota bacterium]